MAKRSPPAPSSSGQKQKPVATLHPNDVLLGRGNGSNEYIGNQTFRALIKLRREEYALSTMEEKRVIANQIYTRIVECGGRFLKMDKNAEPVDNIVEEGTWYECDRKTGVDKVKQALREKNSKPPAAGRHATSAASSVFKMPPSTSLGLGVRPQSNVAPVLPATFLWDVARQSGTDLVGSNPFMMMGQPLSQLDQAYAAPNPHLSLLAQLDQVYTDINPLGSFLPVQSPHQPDQLLGQSPPDNCLSGNSSLVQQQNAPLPASVSYRAQVPPVPPAITEGCSTRGVSIVSDEDTLPGVQGSSDSTQAAAAAAAAAQASNENEDATTGVASISTGDSAGSPSIAEEDEISEYLLSVLALSGREKFTDQQISLEQASMTNEERAKVLCDLFGKYCNVHQDKKAKRDLGKDEVSFLVAQMRLEIDKIPNGGKEALLKAQQHCRSDEFSDARLERFLLCEGMDVKLGACRFVNYWKCRREVFGDTKFIMRMTLAEALRDDLAALMTRTYCLLPRRDLSGRQILYLDPSKHTRDGYTSESLLRAIWYVIEVTSSENMDRSSHDVQICWCKTASLFDYDHKVYDRMHYFEATAWPIRKCSFHVCCQESYITRILKSVLLFISDRESRARMLFHTVPESELLSVLSNYGIEKNMLPKDMGGTLELDQYMNDWIANRRAAELEEL